MKTNKEFINGVYEKFEEYSKEKKDKKHRNINKIVNMAAIVLVAVSLVVISVDKQEKTIIENGNIQQTKISLKTVGNFDNFYHIIKQNYLAEKNNEIKDLHENIAEDNTLESAVSKNETTIERSVTNVQEENVNEADIVKTDGNYIYYVIDKKIIIARADKPENLEKVAEINYEQEKITPIEIYIKENKLIVIVNEFEQRTAICKTESIVTNDVLRTPNTQKSGIILYDITIKTDPKEIRRVQVYGYHISSRMIGNNIYFVSRQTVYGNEIIKHNIQDLNENIYKPQYIDTAISEEECYIDYNKIYCFEKMETINYLILVGLNIENNEEVDIQTFLGAGQKVYCSEKNMYIATTNTTYNEKHEIIDTKTHLLKFSLNKGKIKFEKEADVDGEINNQFSMDEQGEYLRIATTTGNVWNVDENTSNNLYVLNENLEKIGEITGFGQEEKIYSVRYMEDNAYVVTFKQTDPLFVIDLSNPHNPQILGKLKIPGYSTYLHPYDKTHIIGFGYDTKEDGTRITTNGLKMVMFDISDLNNPKELFKVTIGNQYTHSELSYNHKALLFSKEKNIIAFPLVTYQHNKKHTRAAVYEIDLNSGFKLKGEIGKTTNDYTEQTERIIYIGDTYYVFAKKYIRAANMETLEIIKEIYF